MKRPTQRDIARIAGVSRATVSLVTNGQTDGRIPISAETRARVLKAVEELGYAPDARGQALRSGDTRNISLVVPDVRNPHYWDNVYGVEEAAHQAGYNIIFTSQGTDTDNAALVIRDLFRQSVDGVILMGALIELVDEWGVAFEKLQRRHLPMVELTDHFTPSHKIDAVISDYSQATREVMQHLLTLGHHRIGFIYGVPHPNAGIDRLQPYFECLKNAGIQPDENLVVHCGSEIEAGYTAAMQLLQAPERPTAIVVINDLLSISAMRAATDLGLSIPEDLSIVGYDDIFAANYLRPRLTTVSKDAIQAGRKAVELLIQRIEKPDLPLSVVEFKSHFILRESTGPAPHLH